MVGLHERRISAGIVSAVLLAAAGVGGGLRAQQAVTSAARIEATGQDSAPARREITLQARSCAFTPDRIEVNQDDLLKITLVAEDAPHSFTIDAYRIAKRATPNRPVTFEFRADRPGKFPYYCNLTENTGCSQMQGELVVSPRPAAREGTVLR
jgi:heme/copper-type cytochrome/quinol oxidase subunit 2